MNVFTPQRLTIARQWRGLSMRALSQELLVTPGAITQYESGTNPPSAATLERIAGILRFPLDFFFEDDVDLVDPDTVSFRARSSMSALVRDRAESALWFGAGLIAPWLRRRFQLPEVEVPDLAAVEPEEAADTLRSHWQLGLGPIANMVYLLEAKGVNVFWLNESSPSVDGLSFFRDRRPFVVLNRAKGAPDRSRFDAAHELGHLVLHRFRDRVGTQDQEKEANRFAAAFLLPTESFSAEAPRAIDFSRYIALKRRWGVSIAASIMRSKSIGLITDWQYQSAFREVSRRGWRQVEPDGGLLQECSALHPMVHSRLSRKGIEFDGFCQALHLPADAVTELMPDVTIKRDTKTTQKVSSSEAVDYFNGHEG